MKEHPWIACSDGCGLAEDKLLVILAAAVDSHLSGGRKGTCEPGVIGNILDVHTCSSSATSEVSGFLWRKW